jgi:hypothetical protein
VRTYAEAKWSFTRQEKQARTSIYGDKAKFKQLLGRYNTALMSTLVCTTRCVVCEKTGQKMFAISALLVDTYIRGETLEDNALATMRYMAENAYLACPCKGHAVKKYSSESSTLARLLVVVTQGHAYKYKVMKTMDLKSHGKYILAGVGHCNKVHWTCTFKFGDKWYHYDDLTDDNTEATLSRSTHDFTPNGFTNAVHFYTKE